MFTHGFLRYRRGFTLIELLVVIAIIAILAVVVVLTLNLAELLRQSRDANRLSDMAALNSALNLYSTDQSGVLGFSLGNSSSVYLSLPDTSSSCANLGLSTTSPSGFNYACASSTSSRNINNSGWIPVNFASTTSGTPLGVLPIDPVNQSSSSLYYTYYSNGSQFEVTSLFESTKYKTQYGQKPITPNFPELNAIGSNLLIDPLYNPTGLAGYWSMDEGAGSSTQDLSGNGDAGTLGSFASWSQTCKIGGCIAVSGSGAYGQSLTANNVSMLSGVPAFTISLWVYTTTNQVQQLVYKRHTSAPWLSCKFYLNANNPALTVINSVGTNITANGNTSLQPNQWYHLDGVYNGSNIQIYVNGIPDVSSPPVLTGNTFTSNAFLAIGGLDGGQFLQGAIDDVRIYNRALSAAEIQAFYNAER